MNMFVLVLKMISEPQMPPETSPGTIDDSDENPLPMYSQWTRSLEWATAKPGCQPNVERTE